MNIAILIDAENVLPAHADLIFSHAAGLGEIVRKEIYGAAQALTTWVEPVLKYAIHPNLTIRASKGKNSSDIALVIGAMDVVVSGSIDTVIIASSDSDFSALSVRLRNAGIEVIGMGTEKANQLWRTACTNFVVLQQPQKQQKASQPKPSQQQAKPAKAAPQQQQKTSQQPQQQKPAPAQPAQPAEPKQEKPVAGTHGERTEIIRAFIASQLEANGGRLQVNNLFPGLNNLPEYRVDQKRSRRKPLNYLTRQFRDAFRFEDASDGNSWVSFAEAAAPETPEAEPAPVEAPEAAPAETEAPAAIAETAPEAPAVVEAAPVEAAPEAETVSVDALELPDEPQAAPDPLPLLMEAGISEEVAQQIVVIFTESANLRTAYNRLRKTFGNTAGREYYQQVKEIAERNQ